MNNIVNSEDDPEGLNITSPRKTELRDRKNVNYNKLNRVGSIVSNDDSEDASKIKK